jgi:formylmethanofuran dehydrogenase subunit E
MKLTEKMSYLQGLMDGLEIDTSTKEGKILVQMTEVMKELVIYVEDLQGQVDELTELCEVIDEDLGNVENDMYELDSLDSDDDDDEFDDDELYEVQCPTCGDTILLDDGMLEEGSINCPNCSECLEFDFGGILDEEENSAEA